jgi:hypothetical protein
MLVFGAALFKRNGWNEFLVFGAALFSGLGGMDGMNSY